MKSTKIKTVVKKRLADIITPVSIYLKIRDVYQNTILLESSDYSGNENSFSFICFQPIASFKTEKQEVTLRSNGHTEKHQITEEKQLISLLQSFIQSYKVEENTDIPVNGFFGYNTYDSVQFFETIKLKERNNPETEIPTIYYSLYKYIIAINHFHNELYLIENLFAEEESKLHEIESLLYNRNFAQYPFKTIGEENTPITNEEFVNMVTKGKEHCFKGDVFQIVLSRRFEQAFQGDEFNVYRALRSLNPSPYLFYFDYGNFRLFGSSPEAQLVIKNNKAYINPIAGTFLRTGDAKKDEELSKSLLTDAKENAEHIMLVDLARNDLSRSGTDVEIEKFKEIQFYSHVIHMVSKVKAELQNQTDSIKVFGDTFPAGTLTGAPKFKAMELIDKYEKTMRSFYGGSIGYLGFNGDINQAIIIRSFLSKNNKLFYQAGAGVVSESVEEKELQEVNNKLSALRKALKNAEQL